MEKLIVFLENLIFAMIPELIFGVRAQGEKLSEPTFKTVYPDNQPKEFEWNAMFRVSSLCGVNQRVCLDGPTVKPDYQPSVKKTLIDKIFNL
jgi:hypothetical protein